MDWNAWNALIGQTFVDAIQSPLVIILALTVAMVLTRWREVMIAAFAGGLAMMLVGVMGQFISGLTGNLSFEGLSATTVGYILATAMIALPASGVRGMIWPGHRA